MTPKGVIVATPNQLHLENGLEVIALGSVLPAGQPRTSITGGRSLFGAFARGHSRIDGCAVYNRHFERSSQPVRGRDPENFHKPELDSSCATAPIIPRRKKI